MRLRTLLIGLALVASCIMLRGQEWQTVERTGGVTAVVPSLQNLCRMLEMDGDKVAEVLSGFGYTELQATDGYRRFSNGTEQHPSYTQGLQLFFLGTARGEVRCVVSHDLAPLAEVIWALKEELADYRKGVMRDNDGYPIEVFTLHRQAKSYSLFITTRPMYYEVSLLKIFE